MNRPPERVPVIDVRAGDLLLSSALGDRTVTEVVVRPEFVAIHVQDPANPPKFRTVLDYEPDALVRIRRAEKRETEGVPKR